MVTMAWRRLALAATALFLVQIAHLVEVIIAGPESIPGEGAPGEPLGLLALVGAALAIVAAANKRSYAAELTIASGIGVSAGFLLYHGVPWHSTLTNTYWGRGDVLDWGVVVLCVVVGAWAARVAFEERQRARGGATGGLAASALASDQ
jgi:hypothetical protein